MTAEANEVQCPNEWMLDFERTVFDSFMNREYTRLRYIHPSTDQAIRINEVQEPDRFGGWGFLVWIRGSEEGELGLVGDIETAKELAFGFMRGSE